MGAHTDAPSARSADTRDPLSGGQGLPAISATRGHKGLASPGFFHRSASGITRHCHHHPWPGSM